MRAGGETAPARIALLPIVLREDGWGGAAERMLAPEWWRRLARAQFGDGASPVSTIVLVWRKSCGAAHRLLAGGGRNHGI